LIRAGCDINAKDNLGKTALHYACEFGQDDTIELLLKHNADPNTKEFSNGLTPLHSSVENGQFNAV